ncbi:MAG: aldehyde dehydrogenase family protein [Planctomycetota bacterium]
MLTGGGRAELSGDLAGGYYVKPTIFKGHNKMRVFQEEIFGPVVSATTFTDYNDAIAIATTAPGLGAGVWTRNTNTAYRAGARSGGPRVDQLLPHLPGTAFGGYKQSGIGRETHAMMLRLPTDQKPAGPAAEQPMGFSNGNARNG